MKITQPDYYDQFQCINSLCQDNCCIGWEIDIDAPALLRYQNFSGEWKIRMKESISLEETPHFILTDNRCPFLNKENLCDLILAFGEDSLCQICTEHPRFHQWFPGTTEHGLGLSCEAAGKLIFASEAPASFITAETGCKSHNEESVLLNLLFRARQRAFDLLQNRNYCIEERLSLLLAFGEDLQDCLDMQQYSSIEYLADDYGNTVFLNHLLSQLKVSPESSANYINLFQELLSSFQKLEPIDETWRLPLNTLSGNLPLLLNKRLAFMEYYSQRQYEYEHLTVYYAYRYFMNAFFDGDLLSKTKFTVISFLINLLLDINHWLSHKELSLDDRINLSKAYSKQVEYSQENLRILENECFKNPAFSVSSLLSMLLDAEIISKNL